MKKLIIAAMATVLVVGGAIPVCMAHGGGNCRNTGYCAEEWYCTWNHSGTEHHRGAGHHCGYNTAHHAYCIYR